MGVLVAAVVAFVFLDGWLRWIVIALGVVYELVETAAFVRWSRGRRPHHGPETLLGRQGRVVTPMTPHGQVMVGGERWRAISDMPCAVGDLVEIVGAEGLELTVRPVSRPVDATAGGDGERSPDP